MALTRRRPKGRYGPRSKAHYADPGYQDDRRPRYPLNTVRRVRAAWQRIHVHANAMRYTPSQRRYIQTRIRAEARRRGIVLSAPGVARTRPVEPWTYTCAYCHKPIHRNLRFTAGGQAVHEGHAEALERRTMRSYLGGRPRRRTMRRTTGRRRSRAFAVQRYHNGHWVTVREFHSAQSAVNWVRSLSRSGGLYRAVGVE